MTESLATADDFVAAATGVLFLPEQERAARQIADSICAIRQDIAAAVDRAQLAGEVLPSLEGLRLVIDMRVRVVDGEIKVAVPVAVVHINTDMAEDLWLQLTRADAEEFVTKLSKAIEDMKLAETLTLKKS